MSVLGRGQKIARVTEGNQLNNKAFVTGALVSGRATVSPRTGDTGANPPAPPHANPRTNSPAVDIASNPEMKRTWGQWCKETFTPDTLIDGFFSVRSGASGLFAGLNAASGFPPVHGTYTSPHQNDGTIFQNAYGHTENMFNNMFAYSALGHMGGGYGGGAPFNPMVMGGIGGLGGGLNSGAFGGIGGVGGIGGGFGGIGGVGGIGGGFGGIGGGFGGIGILPFLGGWGGNGGYDNNSLQNNAVTPQQNCNV